MMCVASAARVNAARVGRVAIAMVLACCAPELAGAQSSAHYALPQSTLNAGIGDTNSASYRLSSSLGDPFATGPSTSTGYRLAHGWWGAATGTASAPMFQSAVSRRVHGAAGPFDLPLSAANVHNPTTEPRQGPNQTLVFTFDKPVVSGNAAVTEGTATAGAPTFAGATMTVPLSGVANAQYVTVAVNSIAAADGGTGGAGSIRVGFLLGDVSQNRVVTLADLGLVNAQLAQFVSATNFLKDVNASGTLTLADKAITNANLTKPLPAP